MKARTKAGRLFTRLKVKRYGGRNPSKAWYQKLKLCIMVTILYFSFLSSLIFLEYTDNPFVIVLYCRCNKREGILFLSNNFVCFAEKAREKEGPLFVDIGYAPKVSLLLFVPNLPSL